MTISKNSVDGSMAPAKSLFTQALFGFEATHITAKNCDIVTGVCRVQAGPDTLQAN